MANKIEQQMKEEKLWEWFKDKNINKIWKVACKEGNIKYKDMPWYKKMLFNNDIHQWKVNRTNELLELEFKDALVSGDEQNG